MSSKEKFKVLVSDDATAIDSEYYGKKVEVSDDWNTAQEEDSIDYKYRVHNTYHCFIYKRDCTIVPNKNLIGGKII